VDLLGGKSTVVALLQRFYDPESGAIKIGDDNIKDIQVGYLREQIGIVSQEPMLFNCSIKENVRYGRPGASDKDIQDAMERSNAWNFVQSFEKKWDTEIGSKGTQLSGGQRQRIAIARALLKDPKLLLLDEATSALDNESERLVQEALERLMVGRTTIVIAHRLSTIRNCTNIAVMESGRIVEVGNYDQLVAMNGVFANLVRIGGGDMQSH